MSFKTIVSETYDDMLNRMYPLDEQEDYDNNVFNITFQVTDDCNLCCSYCYQINKGKHKMPFDIAKRFIDMLLDNDELTQSYVDTRRKRAAIIDFIGGEPFLEVELMDQICEYFIEQAILKDHPWQHNYRISVSTNGTLYFNPKVQAFIEKYKEFLSLNITVDGHKELHDACRVFPDGSGSYDLAIAAVRHFRQNHAMHLSSKITLAPGNIEHTAKALISLIEEGYDELNCNCVFEKGWTTEHATIFYYQLKQLADYVLDNNLQETHYISLFDNTRFKPMSRDNDQNWCGGNGIMIAVDYKGDVYPCVRYMESSLGDEVPPIIIGNVYDGLMQDAKCVNCINALKAVNRITQSTEECLNCRVADGCSWCQAYNYQASGGDFNKRATFICVMHKARALANCYYWNRYYLQTDQNKRMKLWLEDEKALEIIPEDELIFLKLLQYPVL